MKVKVLGTVKVLGPGCSHYYETKRLVTNALSELKIVANVREIKDPKGYRKHGILFTPAVIINKEIMSQGKIPKYDEVKRWFSGRANKITVHMRMK